MDFGLWVALGRDGVLIAGSAVLWFAASVSALRILSRASFEGGLSPVRASLWALLLGLACNQGAEQAASKAAEATAEKGIAAEASPAQKSAAPAFKATAPAHGFGDLIAWRGLEEGLQEAATSGKGLMLVVHASWCSKCRDLKPSFFDEGLVAASRDLVMVNLDQDEEPRSLIYSPDGTYVPRVLFIGTDGEVISELKNDQRSRFHYFYTPADDLVGMMKAAALRLGRSNGQS